MGFIPLLFMLGMIVSAIYLVKWVYEIKKNSDIQVEQNKRLLELIESQKIECTKEGK